MGCPLLDGARDRHLEALLEPDARLVAEQLP
jgi:hypothetical protein